MKKILNFIKITAVGGLLVIVPIAIILFVLAQLFYGLFGLSKSLLNDLGLAIDDAILIVALALGILIGLCFLTGLLVQTRLGESVRDWFRRNVASRIPMYNAIASLTERFIGLDGNNFAPIEVDIYGTGANALGFLIEVLPDERCAVYVPNSPVATIGNVYIVDADAVVKLDASVADTITAISQWGVDTSIIYKRNSDDDSQ